MSDSYTDKLVVALRMRDVPGQRIGQVVAEVQTYIADSGQDPAEAFGTAEAYAADIAAELRPGPSVLRLIVGAYPPAVGSLMMVDGLWGVLKAQQASLTVGKALFAALLPLAALFLLSAVMKLGRWAYLTAALLAVAGVGLLWTDNALVLLHYPAWAGLVCGAVLLVGGLSVVKRDPVIDPRTGGEVHPITKRFALLAVAPIAIMLILVLATALLV